jgi:hypothetical protein
MKSLPLPLRVAAGLAVTAVEQARTLPTKLAGLPVTVASQALQVSMRVQQQVTELAIRGDEVLSSLRPVEETPEWATFDEDVDDERFDFSGPSAFDRARDDVTEDTAADTDLHNGHRGDLAVEYGTATGVDENEPDPWSQEERAIAEEAGALTGGLPEAENYDDLSLPQLRARLRRFSAAELAELLDYERANGNRPSFVGMLTRRIATVRDQR